jgi:Fur family transcriptional regulator, zinc uptake regulator
MEGRLEDGVPVTDSHHAHDHAGCAHAADRSARAADALGAAEAACRARGVRLTPIRRGVLAALYATHRPLGAYDIAQGLAQDGSRKLAPITVYRALEFLMAEGLVHRLASRNAFVACPHGHAHQDLVAFLICEDCGGVDEISSRGLSRSLAQVLREQGFEARLQVLEISGLCAHCRSPAA